MKISLRWLNEYIDIQDFFDQPQALSDILTAAGLEVESLQDRARDYRHVVVGHILEKAPHPNADKLTVCRVATGEGVVHQIVCGAKNHQMNDRVVVALPGAVLPGDFSIGQSNIRGVDSGGMLCSAEELGLSQKSEGILILPPDAPVGMPFADYWGLNDVILELKVTPNRADCLSHWGLARELSCLLGRGLRYPSTSFKPTSGLTSHEVKLEVRVPDLCPRYSGRLIRNVKVRPSPQWLKQRLEGLGLKSINNIVDVTNYVMIALGQPLHAFDLSTLTEKQILVDKSKKSEMFETLDGTALEMSGEELVIRDRSKILALAGVVGGKNSGVTTETQSVFLESAWFAPQVVRRTSRRFGIETDSAYRFSRGVDPQGLIRALDLATAMILDLAGGEAAQDCHDHYPQPISRDKVILSVASISERLGYRAEESRLNDYLVRMGCQVQSLGDGRYEVYPPSHRFDLEMEADFIEEYARLTGYDRIPETLPVTAAAPASHEWPWRLDRRVSSVLRGQGFSEAFHFGFLSESSEREFLGRLSHLRAAGLEISEKAVPLMNPLNETLNVMRRSLLTSMWRTVVDNYHHGNERGRLFEIGQVFQKHESSYGEQRRLCLAAWGKDRGLWRAAQEAPLVFEIKAALEALLGNLGFSNWSWASTGNRQLIPDFAHIGQWAVLNVEGRACGLLCTVHPGLREAQKVRCDVALAEIDLDFLYQGQPRLTRCKPISRFPVVERDLAFVMPSSTPVGNVLAEIRQLAGALLVDCQVFDVYQGENLPEGKMSVAFRMFYQAQNGTLQDADVNELQNRIIAGVGAKFSASLR
ncbi:MAG: phenylalanine--tRNA ligase subunit beta [Bdellovibrionaceae bacterium]|nr:phenylalanine--tRNA ligase subunit beta [Pseudobdellovibrionaceae bacterium]